MSTKTLYFDCFAGISGDMAVGAMIDLGIDTGVLKEELHKLSFSDFTVEINKVTKNGIIGTKFNVIEKDPSSHPCSRNIDDILAIIDQSHITSAAKALSKNIFTKLGDAEAKVHNKDIKEIHFHEVGAIDSIVDIVAFAICYSIISPEEVIFSPINVGSGFVRCAHGLLPVPGPAVSELLKNIPIYSAHAQSELTTPTGAAIVRTLATRFNDLPKMKASAIGYGFGSKDFDFPNALRIFKGATSKSGEVVYIETNIDDMNPEIYSGLFEALFKLGALDVFLNQIIMKKNRPGVILSVLCRKDTCAAIKTYILKNTSSFGIRYTTFERDELEREFVDIETRYGKVKAKAGYLNGDLLKISPEYESCQTLAKQTGSEFIKVYNAAVAAIFASTNSKYSKP